MGQASSPLDMAATERVRPFPKHCSYLDAGVDYITASWSSNDLEAFPESTIRGLIDGNIANGFIEHSRFRNGIEWSGCGGIDLGRRDRERFYRASGDCAHSTFLACARSASNVSRIDLQCTVGFRDPTLECAERAFSQFSALPGACGQPRTAVLVQDNSLGQTCSIGSRRSNVYLRIYDHGIAHKSADAGMSWRLEAELKGSMAKRYAALLFTCSSARAQLPDIVHGLFSDRRVDPPWVLGNRWSVVIDPAISDVESKMKWLSGQVAPTIEYLVGEGYITGVLDALRLPQMR